MAVLNAKERRASATYTSNGKGHFPMPDKAHARNALARIKFAPEGERGKIKARARRILGHETPSMNGKGKI